MTRTTKKITRQPGEPQAENPDPDAGPEPGPHANGTGSEAARAQEPESERGETNAELLGRAAAAIRQAADQAAGDHPGSRVCCWDTQRIAHQESVTEVRLDDGGHDEHEVIAVPVAGRVAGHIALWGPNTARAVAAWLETTADLHEPRPAGLETTVCCCATPRCQWCNDEDEPCSDVRHALAVAREILGLAHAER